MGSAVHDMHDRLLVPVLKKSMPWIRNIQEAQLPRRNNASAAHFYLGWLTDRAIHRTPRNCRCCTAI